MRIKIGYIVLFLALFFSVAGFAQQSKRTQLERRRAQLQKDIAYINSLLSNTKSKEVNLLNDVKDLKAKIRKRDQLINAINDEINELKEEIYTNQLEVNKNQNELEALKKEYANMIYQSYKSKSQNSRIMFLLSSDNFYQGFKRFLYMKQYTSFRRKQGEAIEQKTTEILALIDTLNVKKNERLSLSTQMKQEQSKIQKEKQQQEYSLGQIKKKEGKYKSQIRQFQREESRLDAQIEKIIRDAIAASNKNSGNTTTTSSETFVLSPEAKELASQFTLNKGKLPWPVERGYVSMYYGRQPNPIVPTATIQSNGVRITTDEGSKARAVFDGTVLAIQVMSGNKKAVLIQHGNYITVYKNLYDLTVQPGDKVTTKEDLGTIFTDKITGKTILGFVLTKNATIENPADWLYRM